MTAPAWPYGKNHYIGTPRAISAFAHSDGEPVHLVRKALGYEAEGPFNTTDAEIVSAWHRSRGGGDRSTVTEEDWVILMSSERVLSPEPKPEPEKKAARKRTARKKAESDG